MPEYLFFPPADEAQDKIWRYTVDRWGKDQAVKYITELHDHLYDLASQKKKWRILPDSLVVPPDLDISVYFSLYRHHYIFFRELEPHKIGILSILHEKMDIPLRLADDLKACSQTRTINKWN